MSWYQAEGLCSLKKRYSFRKNVTISFHDSIVSSFKLLITNLFLTLVSFLNNRNDITEQVTLKYEIKPVQIYEFFKSSALELDKTLRVTTFLTQGSPPTNHHAAENSVTCVYI